MPDLKLTLNTVTGNYDISLENGDFTTTDGFDSSILVSLFSDARADKSEVLRPEQRRGWWGDECSDNKNSKLGSKLWLLSQARKTPVTLNRAKDYAYQALKWLVDEGYSRKIDVNASFIAEGIKLDITITNNAGATESRSYKIWQNTSLS
jgi:phage gp46-like protein